ncbi:ATG8-interacting protein 1 [Cornus florida]|uniref:ATG8-interacting protein 1 n=1 Tax=Cornus florida TaxID=4283 RepID=UPI0028987ADE|nr:ATG8-interacting protein 1 [Cornus florida]XP_059651386.1 ATG8-interacting protein 1 [Cornus florida]
MADNEEAEQATSRGNEWEVVSLTASAYAAAPGPKHIELNDNDKSNTGGGGEDEAETSHAMFMSGHFVFPPSQHENLPLEPENMEVHNTKEVEDVAPEVDVAEGVTLNAKDEENWNVKDYTMPEEFPGIQFFDKKGNRLSIRGTEFEEGSTLEGLNLTDKEQSIYDAAKLSSFHSETTLNRSTTYDENAMSSELIEPSDQGLDSDISQLAKKLTEEDKYDESELPCEAWWKRRATSLYTHAKEANAFWSIFVAAAVMGLVILGQRWQQERWQVLQLKWQVNINDEKIGKMLGPISRFKDVIVGGSRRGTFVRSSSSTEH